MAGDNGLRTFRLPVGITDDIDTTAEIPMAEFDGGALLIPTAATATELVPYAIDYGAASTARYRLHDDTTTPQPITIDLSDIDAGDGEGSLIPLPVVANTVRAILFVTDADFDGVAVNKRMVVPGC